MVESDEEQLSSQELVERNGQSIVIAIVLGFIGIFGLQAWNEKAKNTAENASEIYQQILDLNARETKENDEAILPGRKLKDDYGRNIYAVLASSYFKQNRMNSELDDQLRWAVDQDHGDAMEDLVRVRLARVLASSNKPDEAF